MDTLTVVDPSGDSRTVTHTVTAAEVTAGSASMTIPTTAISEDGSYSVSAVVTDAAGNASTAGTLPFTLDSAVPVLTSSSPADNATNVIPSNTITLTFNENVQGGAGNKLIYVYNSAGTLIESFNVTTGVGSQGGSVSFSGATATLQLHNTEASNTSYNVRMDAGAVTDVAGNSAAAITNTTTVNFTTANLATVSVSNASMMTYANYLHSVNPNLANTNQLMYKPGSGTDAASRFGTAVFVGQDDASAYYNLTGTGQFGSINLFGTVYTQIGVGSNGYLTFGHLNSGYGAANIPAYTSGPILAIQLDDYHNGTTKGGAASPGGTSMGTNRIYFDQYQYAGDSVMQYTLDDVGYFNATILPAATPRMALRL